MAGRAYFLVDQEAALQLRPVEGAEYAFEREVDVFGLGLLAGCECAAGTASYKAGTNQGCSKEGIDRFQWS
jgi:hypothetical protein